MSCRFCRRLCVGDRSQKNQYSQPSSLRPDMIRNYLKIAFRNLLKNKVFSVVNLMWAGGRHYGLSDDFAVRQL
jgi:hypothetical protein